jgi:hypothetical protein
MPASIINVDSYVSEVLVDIEMIATHKCYMEIIWRWTSKREKI